LIEVAYTLINISNVILYNFKIYTVQKKHVIERERATSTRSLSKKHRMANLLKRVWGDAEIVSDN